MNAPSRPDPLDSTPYRSLHFIGSGAMGDVIAAEHRALGKRVVVKLIRTEAAATPEAEDRFRLESQALAGLDRHPNIVQVFDCGRTPNGRPYLVMEHLQGKTLRDEMAERGPFSAVEAVRLTDHLLAGLEAVHNAGLVHRDVKPSNLFLCDAEAGESRALKILDFGIVKLLTRAAGRRGPAPLTRPTTEGMSLGTPQYLAPEQALGLPVDCRADLYAVGAVLYWMLVGRPPFHGAGGTEAILFAHLHQAPTPPSKRAKHTIPRGLDEVILRALSKRPEDRFGTAAELRAELRRAVLPAPPRWTTTEPLDTSEIRAAGGAPKGRSPSASPSARDRAAPRAPRWASTEPLDTSFVRAAAPAVAAPGWNGAAAGPARASDSAVTISRATSRATPAAGFPAPGEGPGSGGEARREANGRAGCGLVALSRGDATHAGSRIAVRRVLVGVAIVAAVFVILGSMAAWLHVVLARHGAPIVG